MAYKPHALDKIMQNIAAGREIYPAGSYFEPDILKPGVRGSLYKQKGSVWHALRSEGILSKDIPDKLGLTMAGIHGSPIEASSVTGLKPLMGLPDYMEVSRQLTGVRAAMKGLRRHEDPAYAPPHLQRLVTRLDPGRHEHLQKLFRGISDTAKTMVNEHLQALGAVGGSARIFTPLKEGVTPDAVLAHFEKQERAYLKRMQKLAGPRMGEAIFGMRQHMGRQMGRSSAALYSFVETVQQAGYQIGMGISAENVIEMTVQHPDTQLRHKLRLTPQIGERVGILPKDVGIEIPGLKGAGTLSALLRSPGTSFAPEDLGTTPFMVARQVAEADVSFTAGGKVSKIRGIKGGKGLRTATEFHLAGLTKVFQKYGGIQGFIRSDQFAHEVAKEEQIFRGLLVHTPGAGPQALFKAHDVVVMHRTAGGDARATIKEYLGERIPKVYSREPRTGINLAQEVYSPFVEGYGHVKSIAHTAGLNIDTVKPELLHEQGVLSMMSHKDLMAFASNEDRARQLYQMMAPGMLAGGASFHPLIRQSIMEHKIAPKLGRISAPWFTTSSRRAMENLSINLQKAPTQLMGTVAAITDPGYALGFLRSSMSTTDKGMKKLMEQVVDPASGGVWVSESMAKALTADVTSQLDLSKRTHQDILNYMTRKGNMSIFESPEGKRLLERGGVGAHIMIGRAKHTISGVFNDAAAIAYAKANNAQIADILLPGMDPKKYPGMMREMLLTNMLEKVAGEIDYANPATAQLKALQQVAKQLGPGTTLQMVPDIARREAARALGTTITDEKLRMITGAAFPDEALPVGFSTKAKEFSARIQEGYVPQFVMGETAHIDEKTFRDVSSTLKKAFGESVTKIGQEQFAAPLASATGAMAAVSGYRFYMPVSLRAKSFNLMARASRAKVGKNGFAAGLQLDMANGYKLQQKILKRLDIWGDQGKDVANVLREVFKTKEVKDFAQRMTIFGEMFSGRSLTEESLNKAQLKKVTADQFLERYTKGVVPDKLRDVYKPEGTYFDRMVMGNEQLSKGFVLELDDALDYKLAGTGTVEVTGEAAQAVRRKQIYMFGPQFYEDQLRSGSPLTAMARAEETLLLTALGKDTGLEKNKALQEALEDYERLTVEALGGKEGMFAERMAQPRLRGGGWASIVEANYMTHRQRFDKGAIAISQEYAEALGLPDMQGITRNKEGKLEGFVYGLVHRDPAQGAGNVAAAKFYIDQELTGRKMVVDPQIYRRALGDTDQDTMSFLLGTTKGLHEKLKKLHGVQYAANIPQYLVSMQQAEAAMDAALTDLRPHQQVEMYDFFEKLEKAAGNKSGAVFYEKNKLIQAFEHVSEDVSNEILRIHSTKITTGQIHVGHELLRDYLAGDTELINRFQSQAERVGMKMTNVGLIASNLMQTAEEIATIKKASVPRARLLELLEEAALRPIRSDDVERVTQWRTQVKGAIFHLHEEIFGGKGIPIPEIQKIHHNAELKDLFQEAGKMYMQGKVTTKAAGEFIANINRLDPNINRQLDVVADYMSASMRTLHEELGAAPLGGYSDEAIAFMRKSFRTMGDSPEKRTQLQAERFRSLIDKVMAGNTLITGTEGTVKDSITRNLMSRIEQELDFQEMEPVTVAVQREMAQEAEIDRSRLNARTGAMDEFIESIEDWWANPKNKKYKWAFATGGALMLAAGTKNLLFPNVTPEYPRQPDHAIHNPPFLGYASGPGFRNTIPPNMGEGMGMDVAPTPGFGPGLGTPTDFPVLDSGMSFEAAIPPPMIGRGSPMPPMPVMSDGMPIPDTSVYGGEARTYVEPPVWTRPMGAGIRAENSVDYAAVGYSADGIQSEAQALGMMTESQVRVSVNNMNIDPGQARAHMRASSNGSFYFGNDDVKGIESA